MMPDIIFKLMLVICLENISSISIYIYTVSMGVELIVVFVGVVIVVVALVLLIRSIRMRKPVAVVLLLFAINLINLFLWHRQKGIHYKENLYNLALFWCRKKDSMELRCAFCCTYQNFVIWHGMFYVYFLCICRQLFVEQNERG